MVHRVPEDSTLPAELDGIRDDVFQAVEVAAAAAHALREAVALHVVARDRDAGAIEALHPGASIHLRLSDPLHAQTTSWNSCTHQPSRSGSLLTDAILGLVAVKKQRG
jgi:hypothetical protein